MYSTWPSYSNWLLYPGTRPSSAKTLRTKRSFMPLSRIFNGNHTNGYLSVLQAQCLCSRSVCEDLPWGPGSTDTPRPKYEVSRMGKWKGFFPGVASEYYIELTGSKNIKYRTSSFKGINMTYLLKFSKHCLRCWRHANDRCYVGIEKRIWVPSVNLSKVIEAFQKCLCYRVLLVGNIQRKITFLLLFLTILN